MAFMQRLGGYTFEWNPDQATIPEIKKTVAQMETYESSAIFQWDAFLVGTKVRLTWSWMSEDQYDALRNYYLDYQNFYRWIHTEHEAFTVAVTNLTGTFVETALSEQPYRLEVDLDLNIRSTTSASTTTTTV
jgi:hypothetical protein